MQSSGIKIDINSKNLLLDNSEKIEQVIKFAVKQAVLQKESKPTPKTSKKSVKLKTGAQASRLA